MSCGVNFDKVLSFDCIQEIILDVRNNSITAETVKKGLWALGCGVEFFAPKQLIGDDSEENKTIEQLCDDLEMAMSPVVFGVEQSEEEKANLNPLVWISLAQLVWQVIKTLRNRT